MQLVGKTPNPREHLHKQMIKNNLEKFDDDFMFELSDEEVED